MSAELIVNSVTVESKKRDGWYVAISATITASSFEEARRKSMDTIDQATWRMTDFGIYPDAQWPDEKWFVTARVFLASDRTFSARHAMEKVTRHVGGEDA